MRTRLVAAALVTMAWPAAFAQVDVRASVSADTVGLDGSIEYQVSVRGAGVRGVEPPELPPPEGLTLFGRTQSSEVSIVDGSVERRIVFTLVYRPFRLGTVVLGPAVVEVGGERYTAPPLTVTVVPAGSPAPGRAQGPGVPPAGAVVPPPFADEEAEPRARAGGLPPIFVTNRLDRDTVYVGEQVVLSFAFYQSSRAVVLDQPNYSSAKTPGFWTQDFNREPEITRELLDGEPYTIQRFRYALFPLTAGEKTIAPATLTLTLRVAGSFFDRGHTRTLTGDTLELTVLPLPADGRPPDFSGAVGRYRLEARVEPRELERDAPANLVLTVSGEGNVATVPPPSIEAPEGVKLFDPEVRTRAEAQEGSVGGSKEFRFLLVPKRSGPIDLGTVSLSYFDPDGDVYRTATADLGRLAVRQPTGGVEPVEARAAGPLAGIRDGPLDASAPPPWRRARFWALAALPPVALALLALARRRPRPAPRLRRVRLSAAGLLRADTGPEGVARAERNLIDHLEARWAVRVTGLPVAAVETVLRRAGAPEAEVARAGAALRELESVAFAPPLARGEALAQALSALEEVEAGARRRRLARAAR